MNTTRTWIIIYLGTGIAVLATAWLTDSSLAWAVLYAVCIVIVGLSPAPDTLEHLMKQQTWPGRIVLVAAWVGIMFASVWVIHRLTGTAYEQWPGMIMLVLTGLVLTLWPVEDLHAPGRDPSP
jgi:hypothetical protein